MIGYVMSKYGSCGGRKGWYVLTAGVVFIVVTVIITQANIATGTVARAVRSTTTT
jgi:hypothetical protein